MLKETWQDLTNRISKFNATAKAKLKSGKASFKAEIAICRAQIKETRQKCSDWLLSWW